MLGALSQTLRDRVDSHLHVLDPEHDFDQVWLLEQLKKSRWLEVIWSMLFLLFIPL